MSSRSMTLREQLTTQLSLAVAGLLVLVPILWMIRLAFDATIAARPQDAALLPHQWTLENFRRAWDSPTAGYSLVHLLGNSLFVAGSTALIALIFGTVTAYAFARYRFPGRRVGLFAMLVLLTLPPAYRSAVVLRHVDGLSYPELAAALDRPEGTVKAQVHRGLAMLRTAFEAALGGEDVMAH